MLLLVLTVRLISRLLALVISVVTLLVLLVIVALLIVVALFIIVALRAIGLLRLGVAIFGLSCGSLLNDSDSLLAVYLCRLVS